MPNVRWNDRRNRERLPALRRCFQDQFARRLRAYHNASDLDFVCSLTTLFVSPKPAPKRRPANLRWTLRDREAGSLQMFDQPLRDDLGHDLIGAMRPLAASKP